MLKIPPEGVFSLDGSNLDKILGNTEVEVHHFGQSFPDYIMLCGDTHTELLGLLVFLGQYFQHDVLLIHGTSRENNLRRLFLRNLKSNVTLDTISYVIHNAC